MDTKLFPLPPVIDNSAEDSLEESVHTMVSFSSDVKTVLDQDAHEIEKSFEKAGLDQDVYETEQSVKEAALYRDAYETEAGLDEFMLEDLQLASQAFEATALDQVIHEIQQLDSLPSEEITTNFKQIVEQTMEPLSYDANNGFNDVQQAACQSLEEIEQDEFLVEYLQSSSQSHQATPTATSFPTDLKTETSHFTDMRDTTLSYDNMSDLDQSAVMDLLRLPFRRDRPGKCIWGRVIFIEEAFGGHVFYIRLDNEIEIWEGLHDHLNASDLLQQLPTLEQTEIHVHSLALAPYKNQVYRVEVVDVPNMMVKSVDNGFVFHAERMYEIPYPALQLPSLCLRCRMAPEVPCIKLVVNARFQMSLSTLTSSGIWIVRPCDEIIKTHSLDLQSLPSRSEQPSDTLSGEVAYVDKVNDVLCIHLTQDRDSLSQLQTILNSSSIVRSLQSVPREQFLPGYMCLAYFEDCLYRAAVKDVTFDDIIVEFIDYGNVESIVEAYVIPSPALMYPPLCVKCKLSDLPDIETTLADIHLLQKDSNNVWRCANSSSAHVVKYSIPTMLSLESKAKNPFLVYFTDLPSLFERVEGDKLFGKVVGMPQDSLAIIAHEDTSSNSKHDLSIEKDMQSDYEFFSGCMVVTESSEIRLISRKCKLLDRVPRLPKGMSHYVDVGLVLVVNIKGIYYRAMVFSKSSENSSFELLLLDWDIATPPIVTCPHPHLYKLYPLLPAYQKQPPLFFVAKFDPPLRKEMSSSTFQLPHDIATKVRKEFPVRLANPFLSDELPKGLKVPAQLQFMSQLRYGGDITHWSGDAFCLRVFEDEWSSNVGKEVDNLLKDLFQNNELVSLHHSGDAYVNCVGAVRLSDGIWYRCRILFHKAEFFTVQMLDIGSSISVPASEVYGVPENIDHEKYSVLVRAPPVIRATIANKFDVKGIPRYILPNLYSVEEFKQLQTESPPIRIHFEFTDPITEEENGLYCLILYRIRA